MYNLYLNKSYSLLLYYKQELTLKFYKQLICIFKYEIKMDYFQKLPVMVENIIIYTNKM